MALLLHLSTPKRLCEGTSVGADQRIDVVSEISSEYLPSYAPEMLKPGTVRDTPDRPCHRLLYFNIQRALLGEIVRVLKCQHRRVRDHQELELLLWRKLLEVRNTVIEDSTALSIARDFHVPRRH